MVAAVKAQHADIAIDTIAPLIGMLRSGDLRALAVTSATRFAGLPDLPTVKEDGFPDYDVSVWNGLAAPAGTPRAVIDQLNREINAVLAMPDVQQQFLDLGITARGGRPEDLAAIMVKEIARWELVIAKSKIEKQ